MYTFRNEMAVELLVVFKEKDMVESWIQGDVRTLFNNLVVPSEMHTCTAFLYMHTAYSLPSMLILTIITAPPITNNIHV